MNKHLTFLDLFAGGGGLSEGLIQAGFRPVAHVESDQAACFTLRTRMAYHWLQSNNNTSLYSDYLNGNISRPEFYKQIPKQVTGSVINAEIGNETLSGIFQKVDKLSEKRKIDLIIGGPPCQAYSFI